MCKCSFVLVACLAAATSAQQFGADELDSGGATVGARSAEVSLIFDNSKIVVNPGEPLHLDCGVRGQSRYCIWESDNGQIIQVQDVYSGGVYDSYSKPEDTHGNECGIVVNSANTEHHGEWTCKVFVPGKSLIGTKPVVVTIKPTHPNLEIDNQRNFVVGTENEENVVCSVAAARPAVDLHWYLGDMDLTTSSEKEETPTDTGGIFKTVSTLKRRFLPSDNGKVLMCSITHKTLDRPENASVPVFVEFKPVDKDATTFYQIQPGSDYEIKFNFTANPEPVRQVWKYGEDLANPKGTIIIPAEEGRYLADIEALGNDKYTAKLLIRDFTEEDANMKYLLEVQNQIGQTEYNIRLSMHDAPQETLSGGAIAGIVIVLLVVVVALVAAGYARYRQMFCFAPVGPDLEAKDIREEHSDTESARGPSAAHPVTLKDRLGQFTKVFKKSKMEQDVKMDDVEKKSLTKDEMNKETANKENNPEEKELSDVTRLPEETDISHSYCQVKPHYEENQGRPLSNEILYCRTEGTLHEETIIPQIKIEPNEFEMKEVVYAELDLSKGEIDKKADVKTDEKTEYAQIVGTITDNREDEKKE